MSCPKCAPASEQNTTATLTTASGEQPTILLVGNPNVGKSTFFNQVTGARQTVINAPGTTVEIMSGTWRALGARLLDMPGTYSLVAHSQDEQVVVDTLAAVPGSFTDAARGKNVDLVLVLLDATAMTRSLYLLGQVARTGRPVAALVTLADISAHEGESVDTAALSQALGIPVMTVDPRTPKGIEGVADMVGHALHTQPHVLGLSPDPSAPGHPETVHATRSRDESEQHAEGVQDEAASLQAIHDADEIFDWVNNLERQAFGSHPLTQKMSRSDKIDRFLLHPVIGIPVFFALMWFLFKIAGEWVGPVQDLFDSFLTNEEPGTVSFANALNAILAFLGWDNTWLQGLLIGGLTTGLGVVASFVPLMFVIFLLISILEDSGYMARAAFLGDRVMRAIGLDGRVILPLIMGFGCNLPSLAATRTLPNERQRLVTTLITPYTSCAARLTIYLLIARIFFPNHAGTVVFALYVLSLVLVVLAALVLKPFTTKNEAQAPLMLVLPPYQMPRVVVTLKNTWMRALAFVKGAGKVIIAMSLVVWLMSAIPVVSGHSFADEDLAMEDSLYGATAKALEPVFAPTGFGEWHMTGALMTGFVAKETVISSIVTSYNLDPESDGGDAEEGGSDLGSLPQLVTQSFEKSAGDAAPIAAFAFMVFVLAYTPCLATVAEQARQIGGRKTVAAVVVQLVAAWMLAVVIFQVGQLIL